MRADIQTWCVSGAVCTYILRLQHLPLYGRREKCKSSVLYTHTHTPLNERQRERFRDAAITTAAVKTISSGGTSRAFACTSSPEFPFYTLHIAAHARESQWTDCEFNRPDISYSNGRDLYMYHNFCDKISYISLLSWMVYSPFRVPISIRSPHVTMIACCNRPRIVPSRFPCASLHKTRSHICMFAIITNFSESFRAAINLDDANNARTYTHISHTHHQGPFS